MKGRPCTLTPERGALLRLISIYEILDSRDLSLFHFGPITTPCTCPENPTPKTLCVSCKLYHSRIATIDKHLYVMDKRLHLIHRLPYDPEDFRGRGMRPNLAFLSHKGEEEAAGRWPETYPHAFYGDRSTQNLDHDHKRALSHRAVDLLCQQENLDLAWRKGQYGHEDDAYEITRVQTAHFLHEEENKPKSFKALYDKLKVLVHLHGTAAAKKRFGFRNYTVTVPMRNREAMDNVLIHFRGGCNCVDKKLQKKHAHAPFTLLTDVLAFTTHKDITTRTGEKIFETPNGSTFSYLDFVR